MDIKKISVKIRGIAPLLHHAYKETMEERQTKRKTVNLSKEEEAKDALYTDEKGEIYQPSNHIEGALIKASSNFKWSGKKTYKDLMKSAILVEPQEIYFPESKNYKIDVRTAVIPATRGRVFAIRPRWDKWTMEFSIIVMDAENIANETLKQILEYAGRFIGIGTFRPKFGRFEVTKFEEIKDEEIKDRKV